jgi:hypothetical protein
MTYPLPLNLELLRHLWVCLSVLRERKSSLATLVLWSLGNSDAYRRPKPMVESPTRPLHKRFCRSDTE